MNAKKTLGWMSLMAAAILAGRVVAQPPVHPKNVQTMCSDTIHVDTGAVGYVINTHVCSSSQQKLCQVDTNYSACPNNPHNLCASNTSYATFAADTVVGTPDSNGFYTIFNGKDLTGWWQNCFSVHSSNNRTLGAMFIADSVHHAIYAMQRNGCYQTATGDSGGAGCTSVTQVGGLLATHKKYANYELIFDWWPDYGNDGGVFNRLSVTSGTNVASNQMVMDYLDASGILSYYSEAGWPGSRNGRPWTYTGATPTTPGQLATGDTILAIPGSGGTLTTGTPGNDLSNWTGSTKNMGNPTKYGCAATGCVGADYNRLWNRHGWNQLREKMYGGLSMNQTTGTALVQSPPGSGDKIHGFTWFRKFYPLDTTVSSWVPGVTDTAQWIPVVQDSIALPNGSVAEYSHPSWFAFQAHYQARYRTIAQGGKGSWMRNIKIRELDSLGNPLFLAGSCPHCTGGPGVAVNPQVFKPTQYNLRVVSGNLVGSMTLDHLVIINDLTGRVVKEFSGMAGNNLKYAIPASGTYLVEVRTSRGTQTMRVINGISQ